MPPPEKEKPPVAEPPRDTLELGRVRVEDLRSKLRGPAPIEGSEPPRLRWHLESMSDVGALRRIPIHPLPFRIGRLQGVELMLSSNLVSKTHSELYEDKGSLRLRDLGSTNGTFLNGKPIQDEPIREGDVLNFADFEFRVGVPTAEVPGDLDADEVLSTIHFDSKRKSSHFVPGTREMRELLDQEAVTVVYQSIVSLPDGRLAAYEALGRGRHPGLPESPLDLFRIAESMGAEAELSRLFRKKAVELVKHRDDLPTLFLNTHPRELSLPGLLESLEDLRRMDPVQDLALEIHESVLTGASALAELRTLLSESNIGLAYDDFGAGQARLIELADAPPHYLKFDRRFVTGIHQPELSRRRRLLGYLVAMANDLLVKTLAEGIETPEEAEVCTSLGFVYAQGYRFSRPVPVDQLP